MQPAADGAQRHVEDFGDCFVTAAIDLSQYKHGPVLGEYVARRVAGQDRNPELEPVFRLKPQTF